MTRDAPFDIARHEGKTFGTRILTVTGPLTLHNVPEFVRELKSGQPPLLTILDLTHADYLDSAGMGAILNYYVHCQKNKIRLVFAGVHGRALSLFRLTQVESLLTIYPTLAEAEQAD